MGMFDTIYATCPNCGAEMEEQTKHGPCLLNDYHVKDMMDKEDAMMVDGMYIDCIKCNSHFKVEVLIPEQVQVKLIELKKDDEEE